MPALRVGRLADMALHIALPPPVVPKPDATCTTRSVPLQLRHPQPPAHCSSARPRSCPSRSRPAPTLSLPTCTSPAPPPAPCSARCGSQAARPAAPQSPSRWWPARPPPSRDHGRRRARRRRRRPAGRRSAWRRPAAPPAALTRWQAAAAPQCRPPGGRRLQRAWAELMEGMRVGGLPVGTYEGGSLRRWSVLMAVGA